MDFAMFIYAVFCIGIGLMALETIDYGRWRWSLAGMFKFTVLVAVLLAVGRMLALV